MQKNTRVHSINTAEKPKSLPATILYTGSQNECLVPTSDIMIVVLIVRVFLSCRISS